MRLNTKELLVLIFIFALAIRFFSVYTSPIKWWDETIYADLGWNLKSNPFDYSFKYFGDRSFDFPNQAGFRSPLLSYTLAAIYTFTDNNTFIELLMPFVGAICVVVIFLLVTKMFDDRVALLSAVFLAVLPLHAYFSGKILTDVFATTIMTISILFFWLGFVKGSMKFKILCGVFTSLAILARYTLFWLPMVFLIFLAYLTIKNRKLSYFMDRGFLYFCLALFLTFAPWFWYSYNAYGTPIGFLIHAQKAVTYWGGVQPWYFYFQNMPTTISLILIPFLIGLLFTFKEFRNEISIFLLLWVAAALIVGIAMQHKEDRFILPVVPVICILAAVGVNKLNINLGFLKSNIKTLIVLLFVLIIISFSLYSLSTSLIDESRKSYSEKNLCYLETVKTLAQTEKDSLIFTDTSPVVYYYSHRETRFIPSNYSDMKRIATAENRSTYYLWSEYDQNVLFEEAANSSSIFHKCPGDGSLATVYKINT